MGTERAKFQDRDAIEGLIDPCRVVAIVVAIVEAEVAVATTFTMGPRGLQGLRAEDGLSWPFTEAAVLAPKEET